MTPPPLADRPTKDTALIHKMYGLTLGAEPGPSSGKMETGRVVSAPRSAPLDDQPSKAQLIFEKQSKHYFEESFPGLYTQIKGILDGNIYVLVNGEMHLNRIVHLQFEELFEENQMDPKSSLGDVEVNLLCSYHETFNQVHSQRKDQGLGEYSSLIWAIEKGFEEIGEAIASKCSELSKQDKQGCTPLILALKQKQTKVAIAATARMTKEELEMSDKNGDTPLIWALKKREKRVARRLIKASAGLGKENQMRESPLYWARRKGLRDIALELLKTDVKYNISDAEASTFVVWAIERDEVNLALSLAQRIKSLNIRRPYNNRLLMWAWQKGAYELVKKLSLKPKRIAPQMRGALLSRKIESGKTRTAIEMVRGMSKQELEALDILNRTPLSTAIREKNTKVALAILDKGVNFSKFDEDLITTAISKKLETVAIAMIERLDQSKLEKKDRDGNTYLFWALEYQLAKTSLALIEHMDKSALEYADDEGDTPICFAIHEEMKEIALALAEKGVDVSHLSERQRGILATWQQEPYLLTPSHSSIIRSKEEVQENGIKRKKDNVTGKNKVFPVKTVTSRQYSAACLAQK